PEYALVKVADCFGVERIERDVGDARHPRSAVADAEIRLRQAHGIALRIVDARLAVLQVAAFRDHGPARIERAIALNDVVDALDGDAEMMQAERHVRLAQRSPVAYERKLE